MRDLAASYDTLGRKQPARLNFLHFARAIPGYANQFQGRVPPNFYTQVSTDVVEVACPYKGSPLCAYLVPTACACGRVYAYTGNDVRVAYMTVQGADGES